METVFERKGTEGGREKERSPAGQEQIKKKEMRDEEAKRGSRK